MAVTAIEPLSLSEASPRLGALSDQTLTAMAAYFTEKDHTVPGDVGGAR